MRANEFVSEISDQQLQRYLDRAGRQVDARQERMARVRDRLNKGYEIYHAEEPTKIVDRFEARTPQEAKRYYNDFITKYESDVDYDLRLRRATGIMESTGNTMSTEDMIAYLRRHHDTNIHQDYLDHINTFGKFALKNIPTNTLKTELSGLDPAKVERYKQMDFSKAPPIVTGDGYILDGYHRAVAAKELGIPTIRAYVGIKDQQGVAENFADGKVKGKSRPGRVKRAGASCNGSVTDLRRKAKNASGEKAKMYHWCANMKSGRKK
jgi:hypothetical protein